ncbi:MAG: dehydratase [Porticoccaceae bacterium]|jgi:acyl dehydratase|nr:dehydratase [Porticoccaceae bacterium]
MILHAGQVAVGDRLPTLVKPPITRATLAYFCGASNDHNPLHVDPDVARAAGMEDVFAHGMLNMAYLGQLLTGWVAQACLRSFEVKFGAIVRLGEQLVCNGEVVDKQLRDDGCRIVIRLLATNLAGEEKLTGEAVVELPLAESAQTTGT